MQYDRQQNQLLLCALVVCLSLGVRPARAQSAAEAQPDQCKPPSRSVVGFCCVGNLCLKKTSDDIARMVCYPDGFCVYNLIRKLGDMDESARCDAQATKALILRQEITEMVQTASLEVDGFLAEIDSETAEIRAVHDRLTDQRDTKVSNSALGSAIGTGGGAVGSALALASDAAMTAGNWITATFGGVGTLYAFLSYFQAHGSTGCFPDVREDPTQKEQKKQCLKLSAPPQNLCTSNKPPLGCSCDSDNPPPGCSPRMLYQLVFPNYKEPPGFHSKYDPVIDKYLGEGQGSWREKLIQPWRKEAKEAKEAKKEQNDGKDEKPESKDEDNDGKNEKPDPNAVLRSEEPFLITGNTDPRKLSIDDLTKRANKLSDLRSVVSRMNRDLSRLTEDLVKELRCHAVDRSPAESALETREGSFARVTDDLE
jgi:hypothetical protein